MLDEDRISILEESMEQIGWKGREKFASPEEEISFLKGYVEELEKGTPVPEKAQRTPSELIQAYKKIPSDEILHPSAALPRGEEEAIVLKLSPESHDTVMSELLGILETRGIKNALGVAEKMNNPHLDDDFARFLVEYLKAGYGVRNGSEKTPFARALRMTLLEISIPEPEESRQRTIKEALSSMEQFYAGAMSDSLSGTDEPDYFSFEIAVSNHSDEFVFYAGVPDSKRNLFEKLIVSIHPGAKIVEKKDDYNIFNESGSSAASEATFQNYTGLPLKLYEEFDHDPLHLLLGSFSKIDRDGEGAAIQCMVKKASSREEEKIKKAVERLRKGDKAKDVFGGGTLLKEISDTAKDLFGGSKKDPSKEEEKKRVRTEENRSIIEALEKKIRRGLVSTNIRLIASSQTKGGAEEILRDLEAAFRQFSSPNGNSIAFDRAESGRDFARITRDFSYRKFDGDRAILLSYEELATIAHYPVEAMRAAPRLKVAKAGVSAPPVGMPEQGTLLGHNSYGGVPSPIYMAPEDRLRHFYTIGQTGTGKTTLMKNMIVQDIRSGHGVCFIDPHGSDINDVLALVPRERYEDVIYFDPSSVERPLALNMLEYDVRFPEQKTFVVNEMLSIFNKLFDMKVAGGPMFEQYFRNAVLLTIEDPESGNTLLDVSRVLASKAFREMKLSKCNNPIVTQFWKEIADKAGGEASLANIVPYITSKFDNFLANDIMRPIIAQERSSFSLRDVMDKRKILLVNLSKGRLGELNSHLLGLIIVGKILMAALSRVDSLGAELPPFYLYIDEFQNVTTDSIATILSEARKYKLGISLAHQFIGQLEDKIKNAVFGNVGSMAVFRVGSEDAEFLEKQFSPIFTAKDITNLDNYHAYLKLLVRGATVKPFDIRTDIPEKGNSESGQKLKELSALKYGRGRDEVRDEIMKKYQDTTIKKI